MEWLWAGFGMGLLGSFHCAGMCGPIALALPFNATNKSSHIFGNVIYQLGRVCTYSVIGLLFGFFGRGFSMAGWQQPLSIATGIFMISLILLPRVFNTHKSPKFLQHAILFVKKRLGLFIQRSGNTALFTAGVLNGFLPCGLVYMALLGAIGIGSPAQSSAFMAFFGLGTFPMMFTIAFSGQMFSSVWRRKLTKLVPVFVVILGLVFILRGLGLGINHISPPTKSLQINATEECH